MKLITLIKYIFLSIIQGITEPIPISSSGHLIIIKRLFNFNMLNDINFEIVVNFGSFIAIFYIFRKEIFSIINDYFCYIKTKNNQYKDNFKYANLIILATIPAGIFGLLFKDKIEYLSSNTKLIGLALIITSISLFLIKDIKGNKDKKDITLYDSIIIGLSQILALFPGISRSGTTITVSSFRNLNRQTAFNFSFMLYLPISFATLILGVNDLIKNTNYKTLILPYLISMLVSTIVTYFSTKWFMNIMKKGKLIYFSIYCIIVGIIVLIFI